MSGKGDAMSTNETSYQRLCARIAAQMAQDIIDVATVLNEGETDEVRISNRLDIGLGRVRWAIARAPR